MPQLSAQSPSSPSAVLGAPPLPGLPQAGPGAVPGAAQPGCGASCRGLACEGGRLGWSCLPRVIPLSRIKGSQQSAGSPSVSQLCLPRRKGNRLGDSTEAPDSHFVCLLLVSHPPHHLWLCLSGTSAHNSIALPCQEEQPDKSTAAKLGVQGAGGVGRGGLGGLTRPCHAAEALPCHPCLESSALHKHECKDIRQLEAPRQEFLATKQQKAPAVLAWHCQMKKDQAEACTKLV